METVEVDPVAPLVKELTATFKVFDKDGDGRISKSELGVVLRSLGDDLSDDELDEVVEKVDRDGDGFIDLEEFVSFHTGRASTASSDEYSVSRTPSKSGDGASSDEKCALQAAFEVFDVDKNGFISAEELQRVMRSLGDKQTSLAECRHMINCVDKDGDSMVDFNEFQCLMSGTFVC
jgi:calcium-binding protein CML